MHGAVQRLYAWARQGELVENDPARDIETVTASARERVLMLRELASVWKAADELDPLYRDLVHLLIATGQRRNEVAGMRWSEINLADGLWTLPGGRTKARRQHVVPLPEAAIAVLEGRQRGGSDDLVLPTIGRDGRSVAAVSGWAWLKRELERRLTIEPWQMHDFRRSLVTHCAESGADVAVLDAMLNHAASMTRGGIVGVYQKATLIGPMREVMALWDRLLTEALSGERKVIRLKAKWKG
jgi:integrase